MFQPGCNYATKYDALGRGQAEHMSTNQRDILTYPPTPVDVEVMSHPDQ